MKKSRNEIQLEISEKFIDSGFFGIINCAPRVGKCKITIDCLNTRDKILIAYPEVNIKQSWINDFKKWKFKGKKIKYTTYQSFKKLRDPCDVLILDEVHLISDAQMFAIKKYIDILGIKKVIGLTGTLADETRDKIYDVLKLPVSVVYTIDEAIRDGVITDYRIDVVFVPLSTVKNIKVVWKGGEFFKSEKSDYDYISAKINNSFGDKMMLRLKRMGIIKKSKAKIEMTKELLKHYQDKRVLVFTGLTEVADSLGIDSYHSGNKNDKVKDDFINGLSNKLAVVKQLNTGITFKSLDTAIINFFDSNCENTAQKISRITCKEMFNESKIAHIIIVCSTEEQEKVWLGKTLKFFDGDKIKYINP